MTIDRNATCAVPGCGGPVSELNNLCEDHRLPGMSVGVGGGTMVVTAWHTEHSDEVGVILLNDLALGRMFGGGARFDAELREQGFVNVRNLATPEDLEAARKPKQVRRLGAEPVPGERNTRGRRVANLEE